MPETVPSVSMRRLSDMASDSAPHLAADLVALFEHVRMLPDKVQWVHRHIADDFAGSVSSTLERACAVVAATIDGDAGALDRQPYHNRQHFCEVALTAYVLSKLNELSVGDTQFVLLGALIHDVVHDGQAHAAFVQERASVTCVQALLEAAGLDAPQLRRLRVLVLATDSACGRGFMAGACKAHDRGDGSFPQVPEAAPELAELVADAHLAELARVLCEADLLPSVGLTIAHAMHLQDCLAREWRRALGPQDKLDFLDAVLAQGFIGEFFLPNVETTRAAVARVAHAPA